MTGEKPKCGRLFSLCGRPEREEERVQCRICRRIVRVPKAGASCACGARYRWEEPSAARERLILHEES
jgi:hypothetical protein